MSVMEECMTITRVMRMRGTPVSERLAEQAGGCTGLLATSSSAVKVRPSEVVLYQPCGVGPIVPALFYTS